MNLIKKTFLLILLFLSFKSYTQDIERSSIKPYFSKLDYGSSGWGFKFLDSIIKDKRIIALGEATHGTKEFFDTKREFFKYLVQEHQFKVFAIEANMADAEVANSYVMNRTGDSKKALESLLFWTWDTKEVLSLLNWMREYNQNQPDSQKIKFYGFDMQDPRMSINYLTRIVSENNLMELSSVKNLISGHRNFWEQIPQEVKQSAMLELENLKSTKSKWGKEADNMALHVRLVEQYLELRSSKGQNNKDRDRFMAENIEWIANKEGENAKIMVWAHNLHVSKLKEVVSFTPMGYHLSSYYKESFLTIGFAFNKGEFRAVQQPDGKLKVNHLGESKPQSLPALLSQFNYSAGYLDLKKAELDKLARKAITENKGYREIGATFNSAYNYYTYRPAFLMFDGLFFFNQTSASIPN